MKKIFITTKFTMFLLNGFTGEQNSRFSPEDSQLNQISGLVKCEVQPSSKYLHPGNTKIRVVKLENMQTADAKAFYAKNSANNRQKAGLRHAHRQPKVKKNTNSPIVSIHPENVINSSPKSASKKLDKRKSEAKEISKSLKRKRRSRLALSYIETAYQLAIEKITDGSWLKAEAIKYNSGLEIISGDIYKCIISIVAKRPKFIKFKDILDTSLALPSGMPFCIYLRKIHSTAGKVNNEIIDECAIEIDNQFKEKTDSNTENFINQCLFLSVVLISKRYYDCAKHLLKKIADYIIQRDKREIFMSQFILNCIEIFSHFPKNGTILLKYCNDIIFHKESNYFRAEDLHILLSMILNAQPLKFHAEMFGPMMKHFYYLEAERRRSLQLSDNRLSKENSISFSPLKQLKDFNDIMIWDSQYSNSYLFMEIIAYFNHRDLNDMVRVIQSEVENVIFLYWENEMIQEKTF